MRTFEETSQIFDIWRAPTDNFVVNRLVVKISWKLNNRNCQQVSTIEWRSA